MPLLRRLDPELRSRVVAIPYLAQPELAAVYRGAVCLVVPSFHESFGMPCVEAMACGCPVLAARASALGEVCGDAAHYIDPAAPRTITEALIQLGADSDRVRSLRSAGLRRATRFTWRATANAVYEVLCGMQRSGQGRPAAVPSPSSLLE
jgi:glycosyltransferase involved in cell wall biosynthesis